MDLSAAQVTTEREAETATSNRQEAGQPDLSVARRKPKLGFLGVGWIGRNRMEAVAKSGLAEVVAIADTSREMAEAAAAVAPGVELKESLEDLLDAGVDGVVIATPSAFHAEQSIAALERGVNVFCQKPLGRNAAETRRVVEAARRADRLLGVDLSYRHVAGMRKIRDLIRGGELGCVYAIDLVFHNAYGPDKSWFYDPRLSGGGCVMDLGIHLVDLALWALDFPRVQRVSSRLFAEGEPLGESNKAEDYAAAMLALSGGAVAQLACSWRLPAGCDAVISASFYGTLGGAALRNVGGSFYDFVAERYRGTTRETLAEPSDEKMDDWGSRAIIEWTRRVSAGATGEGFDPAAERLVEAASALDAIYENGAH